MEKWKGKLKKLKRDVFVFIRTLYIFMVCISFVTLHMYVTTSDGPEYECLASFINYEACNVYDEETAEELNLILEDWNNQDVVYTLFFNYNQFYVSSVFDRVYKRTISSMEEAVGVYSEMIQCNGKLPYCNPYIRNLILYRANTNITYMVDPDCEEYYEIMYTFTRDRIPLLVFKNKQIYAFLYLYSPYITLLAEFIIITAALCLMFIPIRNIWRVIKSARHGGAA